MSFFVESEFSAQNVRRDTDASEIVEDTETRDNLEGTFIGRFAGETNEGERVSALGFNALTRNRGNNNIAIGNRAGENNMTGQNNVFFGTRAGINNTSGNNNHFIGTDAGRANDNGVHNMCWGNFTASALVNRNFNILVGHHNTPESNRTTHESIVIGHATDAGQHRNITCGHNIASRGHSNIICGHVNYVEGCNNILLGHHHVHRGNNVVSILTGAPTSPFPNNLKTPWSYEDAVEYIEQNKPELLATASLHDAFLVDDYLGCSKSETHIISSNIILTNANTMLYIEPDRLELSVSTLTNDLNSNNQTVKNEILLSPEQTIYTGKSLFQNDVVIEGALNTQRIDFEGELDVTKLTVSEDALFNTNVEIKGDLLCDCNVFIVNELDVGDDAYFHRETRFLAPAFFAEALTACNNNIFENIEIKNYADICNLNAQTMTIRGDVHLKNGLEADGLLNAQELKVLNNFVNQGGALFGGETVFEKDVNVKQKTILKGLKVKGSASFEQDTDYEKDLHVSQTTHTKGLEVSESLRALGTSHFCNLNVLDEAYFEKDVLFKSQAIFQAPLSINESIVFSNNTVSVKDVLDADPELFLVHTPFVAKNEALFENDLTAEKDVSLPGLSIRTLNESPNSESNYIRFDFDLEAHRPLICYDSLWLTDKNNDEKIETKLNKLEQLDYSGYSGYSDVTPPLLLCDVPALFESSVLVGDNLNVDKDVNISGSCVSAEVISAHIETAELFVISSNILLSVQKEKQQSFVPSFFYNDVFVKAKAEFDGFVKINAHPLICEKGILVKESAHIEELTASNLVTSNASVNVVDAEHITSTSFSNIQSFVQEAHIDSLVTEKHESALIEVANAYIDVLEVQQNVQAPLGTIKALTSSNLTVLEGSIENLVGDVLDFRKGLVREQFEAYHIKSEEVATDKLVACNLEVTSGIFDEVLLTEAVVNTLYTDQSEHSNLFVKDELVCGELETQQARIMDLTTSNINIEQINVGFVESAQAVFENAEIQHLSASQIETNEFEALEAHIPILTSSCNIDAYSLEAEDIDTKHLKADDTFLSSLTACNVFIDVFFEVRGQSNITRNLTVTNHMSAPNADLDVCMVKERLETPELTVTDTLTFTGTTASFLDKASFTQIRDVNFIQINFDLNVGRYLQTGHSFLELRVPDDARNKVDTSYFSSITGPGDKAYVLPFFKRVYHFGENGLNFNEATGAVRCQQTGMYVIDVYIEVLENETQASDGTIGLLINDVPENFEVLLSDLRYKQKQTGQLKEHIKAHFNAFVETGQYIHLCTHYNTAEDPDLEKINKENVFNFETCYMQIHLLTAFL